MFCTGRRRYCFLLKLRSKDRSSTATECCAARITGTARATGTAGRG